MTDTCTVSHEGNIIAVNGSHVRVKIEAVSACDGCHARRSCGAADRRERIIDAVPNDPNELLQPGDPVIVSMEERLGMVALFYGFFLPFIVMLAVLLAAYLLDQSETVMALAAIGSLVPYYLVLFMIRKKIEKNFIFTVRKKNKYNDKI